MLCIDIKHPKLKDIIEAFNACTDLICVFDLNLVVIEIVTSQLFM